MRFERTVIFFIFWLALQLAEGPRNFLWIHLVVFLVVGLVADHCIHHSFDPLIEWVEWRIFRRQRYRFRKGGRG